MIFQTMIFVDVVFPQEPMWCLFCASQFTQMILLLSKVPEFGCGHRGMGWPCDYKTIYYSPDPNWGWDLGDRDLGGAHWSTDPPSTSLHQGARIWRLGSMIV